MEQAMLDGNIPAWFIDSCKKIKYMFPRGHAVAYSMSSFRIAYYKVHHPLAFYASHFTVKQDGFDAELALDKARLKDTLARFDAEPKLNAKDVMIETKYYKTMEIVLAETIRDVLEYAFQDCPRKQEYMDRMAVLNPNGSTAEILQPPAVYEYDEEPAEASAEEPVKEVPGEAPAEEPAAETAEAPAESEEKPEE
jgi:hypothetical protein